MRHSRDPVKPSLMRRLIAFAGVLGLICSLWVMAFASLRGEYHVSNIHAWHRQGNPLQAFAAANEAYKANPFDGLTRVQLALSMENLLASGRNVKLSPQAADRIHRIASSASPHQPAVMVSRAQYLFNSGRWRDGDEIERIISSLESKARSFPQTWMIVASYAGRSGHPERAAGALVKGLEAGGKFADMQRVARSINMEIEKQ